MAGKRPTWKRPAGERPSTAPAALPADRPTSARRTRRDDELARRRTDVDVAEAVAEGALI